jgi:glycosyltransferase involved in cell wall biosynthesis
MREAVQRLLDDPALRADLVERGLRQAEQFTWEACAARTLDAYDRTLR